MFVIAKVPIRNKDYDWEGDTEQIREKEFRRFLNAIDTLGQNGDFLKLLNAGGQGEIQSIDFKVTEHVLKDVPITVENETRYVPNGNDNLFLELTYEMEYFRHDKFSHVFYANHILKRFSLLANISYITAITLIPGFVYCNGVKSGKTDFMIHAFDSAYINMLEYRWPKCDILSFDEVIAWCIKHSISLDKTSINRANRAINALSYLVSDSNMEHIKSHLFWAMLGIETLFGEGNTGIQKQIRDKVNLVLGEPANFKNRLSKLYNFRSRLVHGDIDFSTKFGEDDWDSFEKEYYDQTDLATLILLASIKRLIATDATEFLFEYKLKGGSLRSIS